MGDGTSLNAKLAALMPIETAGTTRTSNEAENLTLGDQYSITITPGADWYAIYVPTDGGDFVTGDKGKPVTFTAVTTNQSGNSIELATLIGAAPALPVAEEDTIGVRILAYKDITG